MIIKFIEHNAVGFSEISVADLLEKGVPQAAIDVELNKMRFEEIKAGCGKRIYAVASQSAQTNLATAVAVVSGKTASQRSADETAILTNAGLALGWVDAMRSNVATLWADPSLDINDDANWPEVPAEVSALVAQF